MTTRSPESKSSLAEPEKLKERIFDVAGVKVSEHFATKPDFVLKESQIDSDDNELVGYAVEAGQEESFEKNTGFLINQDGSLSWNVDTEGMVGLVLAREDGSINQLGADTKETAGIITSIEPNDELFMLSNTTIAKMRETESFKKNALDLLVDDASMRANIVHITFDEAISYHEAKQNENVTVMPGDKRNNHAIRLRRQAKKLGLPIDATADQVKEAKKARRAAGKPTRTTSADGDDDTAQPKSDSALLTPEQLERNIQKYESRVIKYEELAAMALASRMNGRLFKRKDHHEEFDAKLENNTHFLDGFTMALDNSLMKKWLSEGKDDAEAADLLREHQQARELRRNELNRAAMIDGDSKQFEGENSLKARWSRLKKSSRKAMEWYAGRKTSTKVILGVLGVGVAAGVGATAGAALGAAGAVGLGVAKAGKAYAQQRSKMYAPQEEVTNYDLFTDQRSVREQVIAAKAHSSEQREKSITTADRNKKIAIGLAGVSAILLGAGIVGKIAEHGDDLRDSWSGFWDRFPGVPEAEPTILPESSAEPIPEVSPTPESIPEPEPTPEPTPDVVEGESGGATAPEQASSSFEWFNDASSNVEMGEGWYQTFAEMGITDATEQANLLQKVGPELQARGLAYPMWDGTYGISRPGPLPHDVLKLIQNSR